MITLQDVQRGYDAWAAKPHNAKWVRKIDATPIANDIIVNIFEALKDGGQEVEAVAVVTAYREVECTATIRFLRLGLNGKSPVGIGDKLYTRPQPASTALVERLMKALEEAEETLRLVEQPNFPDPSYHDRVKDLGRQIGFGALMSTASAAWREVLVEKGMPAGSEFVSGPCHGTVVRTLEIVRAALSASTSTEGER